MRALSFLKTPSDVIALHQKAYGGYVHDLLEFLITKDAVSLKALLDSLDVQDSQTYAVALSSTDGRRYVDFIRSSDDRLKAAGGLVGATAECLNEVIKDDLSEFGLGSALKDVTLCRRALKPLFCYDAFRDGKSLALEKGKVVQGEDGSSPWNGLSFLQSVDAHVCPYCNADTVYAVEFKSKRTGLVYKITKSALDHFYCRKTFPYLGLSLYNLVPSCTRCNTSLKNAKTLRPEKVLHPYLDSADDFFSFGVGESCNIAEITDETTSGSCRVRIKYKDGLGKSDKARAKEYIENLFKTEDVYNNIFFREMASVIFRARLLSEDMRKFMAGRCAGIQPERILFGHALEADEINHYRLSKMTKDLFSDVQRFVRSGKRKI